MEGQSSCNECRPHRENTHTAYNFAATLAMCARGQISEEFRDSCLNPYSDGKIDDKEAKSGVEIAELMIQQESEEIRAKLGELVTRCFASAGFLEETTPPEQLVASDQTEAA